MGMRKNSDVTTVAETLKKNQRHRSLLKEISTVQIERLLLVIKNHLNGQTLNDSIEGAVAEMTVDPDLDLNKSKPEEVEKAKRIMDEEFYKKQVKVDDEDFQYDLEVGQRRCKKGVIVLNKLRRKFFKVELSQ